MFQDQFSAERDSGGGLFRLSVGPALKHGEQMTTETRDIYQRVSREVESILGNLEASSQDEELEGLRTQVRSELRRIQSNLAQQQAELEKSAEWNTFTVAFYGETNAGKSSVIETLRILLDEPEKNTQREKFRTLQLRHRLTPDNFEALRLRITREENHIKELATESDAQAARHTEKSSEAQSEIERLALIVAQKKKAATAWQKLLSLFRPLPEENERNKTQAALKTLESGIATTLKRLQALLAQAQQSKQAAEAEFAQSQALLPQLRALSDGNIIGDGRSDFTRDTHRYEFSVGESKFVLLDVPGIEGKEVEVRDQIEKAVRTAHAVFYVTGKAAPPQHGDKAEGTIEKIRKHLGAQTEVWSIYNKRITNPSALALSPELVNAGELNGLQSLSEEMRKQLGEHYRDAFYLSAHPAFLALADHLSPDSSWLAERAKFLSKFDAQMLLRKARFSEFSELLQELAADAPEKIHRSNFNKANAVLKNVIADIAVQQVERFQPLQALLQREVKSTQDQLDNDLDSLKSSLEADAKTASRKLETEVRKDMYERIADGINKDTMKSAFERVLERHQRVLESDVSALLENNAKKFKESVSHMVERFQKHVAELQGVLADENLKNLDIEFNLNLNIDNGLKVGGLLMVLVGGALMFWNPAGLWAIGLSVTGLAVAAYKSVRSWLSDSYKQTQQRKAVDENLHEIRKEIEKALNKNLSAAFPDLEEKIKAINQAIELPVVQIREINRILSESLAKLTRLSNQIQTDIEAKGNY